MQKQKTSKHGFSIAEALVTLAIVGIAAGSAAPLISKTMKSSQGAGLQSIITNQRVDKLEEKIDEIKTELNASINTVKSELETAINSLTNRVTALDNTTNGRVTLLEQRVTTLDANTTGKVPVLETEVKNLKSSVSNLNTCENVNLTELQNQIKSIISRLESLESSSSNNSNNLDLPKGTILFLTYGSTCPSGNWSNITTTYKGASIDIGSSGVKYAVISSLLQDGIMTGAAAVYNASSFKNTSSGSSSSNNYNNYTYNTYTGPNVSQNLNGTLNVTICKKTK